MSCGGPILDLKVPCFVMTPVCPHISISSSIVMSEEREVTVRERYNMSNLYIDGRNAGPIQGEIHIRCADRKLMLYCNTGMKNRISRLSYQEK